VYLTWPERSGVDYVVETSNNLVGWTLVTTLTAQARAAARMGNALVVNPDDSSRFFRVRR
jgi:hypothetical protein